MDYRLVVSSAWRYRDRRRGVQEIAPGTYDVPDQISSDVATLAIDQGVARREDVEKPLSAEVELVEQEQEHQEQQEQQLAPRGRRGRRKRPAPENKIANAPENKATLV